MMTGEETITYKQAAQILADHNPRNRNMSEAYVRKLAHAMEEGLFKSLLSTPVKFYQGGDLADGQHRLAAMVRVKHSYSFIVQRGIQKEDGRVLDIGRNRSGADRLTIRGVKNAKMIAAIARAAIVGGNAKKTLTTAAQVEEAAFAHQHELASWRQLAEATNATVAACFFNAERLVGGCDCRDIARRLMELELGGRRDPVAVMHRLVQDRRELLGGGGNARAGYYGSVLIRR